MQHYKKEMFVQRIIRDMISYNINSCVGGEVHIVCIVVYIILYYHILACLDPLSLLLKFRRWICDSEA